MGQQSCARCLGVNEEVFTVFATGPVLEPLREGGTLPRDQDDDLLPWPADREPWTSTQLPRSASTPNSDEARSVVVLVRALPDPLTRAWAELRQELEVQQLVWQSILLTRPRSGDLEQSPWPEELLCKKLEASVAAAEADPFAAMRRVRAATEGEALQLLNRSMQVTVANVIESAKASDARRQLVKRLEAAGEESEVDRMTTHVGNLQALVVSACLRNAKLEYRVRQLLGLGLRGSLRHPGTSRTPAPWKRGVVLVEVEAT